jgi:hypothetical protein
MIARASILILVMVLSMTASWLWGYHEGEQTGAFHLLSQVRGDFERDAKDQADMDRDQVCNEIRKYKESIARDLDENTQICGWRDMDGGS